MEDASPDNFFNNSTNPRVKRIFEPDSLRWDKKLPNIKYPCQN